MIANKSQAIDYINDLLGRLDVLNEKLEDIKKETVDVEDEIEKFRVEFNISDLEMQNIRYERGD